MWIQKRPTAPARRLSGLLPRRQMQQVLHRERARADRTGGSFSLVQFQSRQRAQASPRHTMRLARLIARRVRLTDEVGWFADDTLCVILHDCPPEGARRFVADVRRLAGEQSADCLCRIYTYPNRTDSSEPPDAGMPDRRRAQHPASPASAEVLMPFVMQGFVSEFSQRAEPAEPMPHIGLEVGQVQALLVLPMPLWKRTLDVMVASLSLLMLWPVMLLVAAAVKLTSPGPAIFAQRRTGLGGTPFTLYKFRTMVADAEARKAELRKFSEQDGPAFKMAHDPRITPIGRFLRSSSLDELPQLWNVLRGDMSLVGPRPLPVAEADACEQWHRQRVDITPGITCIWQVKGRSMVSFADWVRMDLSYLRRRGLMSDLSILFQTIPAVLKRRGAR